MDFRLPIPNNWQDFESICHQLWKEIWNDPNTAKNGRQGQAQNGVDILGIPIYSRTYAGVQCKDKNGLLGSILKSDELIQECGKATRFNPELSSFTLATTSARDSSLQQVARQLTESDTFPFSVQVWSWDDIQCEIGYRPSLLNHFYSRITLPEDRKMLINLNRFAPKEHFRAFFSRPSVSHAIPPQLIVSLLGLVYELSDNAYKYGQATTFSIAIEGGAIVLKDDGLSFNPMTDLSPQSASLKSNIGSFVWEQFISEYEGIIEPSYERLNEDGKTLNVLGLMLVGNYLSLASPDHIELSVNLNDANGRESARRQAMSVEIPEHVKEVIINVTFSFAMSFSMEYVDTVLQRLGDSQKLTISVPRGLNFQAIKNMIKDERVNVVPR